MLESLIKAIFGDPDWKKIKKYKKIVEQIHSIEEEIWDYSFDDIQNKTREFQERFEWLNFEDPNDSVKIAEILDEILPYAFANVKQATKLLNWKDHIANNWDNIHWDMVPYDVQLIWGIAIHKWTVAEMKTGEWKTLVATLPRYLNALTWNPVHIVTVNDYLASRDAGEMGILYNALWLTVWVINNWQSNSIKYDNYHSDIVYATNNEMWFDYLRDNMVTKKEHKVMSKPFFAIIDEVDSILIDEARTPLIISAPDSEPTSKYMQFALIAKELQNKTHYEVDEKRKTRTLTELGITKIEQILKVDNIYVSDRYNDLHHIENALKANRVYLRDRDYIISGDGEVLIVDEHTGRVLPGRRYSDGLHQAIEAKEWVEIKRESITLANITFQNYFRMYWKLSGMTGTRKTEEEEFYKVYSLDTLVIPTNKPIARVDKSDLLFKTEAGKFKYTVKLIKELHETGQPILVWTVSVDKSEYISKLLQAESIPHNVLNAKYHEKEAEIVSWAGQRWAVTIATNMAWRWTDIKLWEWVADLGWLIIIWTEKHETRRIDNQLRGRSGRQWDPGMTQFLLSPNDDIMRIFGWDKIFGFLNSPMFAKLPEDEPLSNSSMLTRKIEWVQKQVEWRNFDARKHILEYDDVMNKHREIIYRRRNKILDSENIDSDVQNMIKDQISGFIWALWASENLKISDVVKSINNFVWVDWFVDGDFVENNWWVEDLGKLIDTVVTKTLELVETTKHKFKDEEDFYDIERKIVLQSIDELWMRHIDNMSKLREAVAFEWYAQKKPINVYKEKAFFEFEKLLSEIWFKTTKAMFTLKTDIEIRQKELDEQKFVMSSAENEALQNARNAMNWADIVSAQRTLEETLNPLFANPNKSTKRVKPTADSTTNQDKKKIRV